MKYSHLIKPDAVIALVVFVFFIAIIGSSPCSADERTNLCTNDDCFPSCGGPAPGPLPSGGDSPSGGAGSGSGSGPILRGHGYLSGKTAGAPIDIRKQAVIEDETDLSIPVKHGLNLVVRRTYSSMHSFQDNRDGKVGLGFSNGSYIYSNWHLYLYESRILIDPETDPGPDPNLMVFISESGNWLHFGYNRTYSASDSDKLYAPDSSDWGSSKYVSEYYPIGDPNSGTDSDYENKKRQTSEDLRLYILHDHNPTSEADRIDTDNIDGFVVRYMDGTQYNYFPNGYLEFIDKNWRNNKDDDIAGHVDDYLRLEWLSDAYCLGLDSTENGNETIPTLSKVYAPPSDGRYLQFNHTNWVPYGLLTHIDSVDLKNNATTYANLVNYLYRASGTSYGKLWRVKVGDDSITGIQYDYGSMSISGNDLVLDEDNYVLGGYLLCRISHWERDIYDNYTITPVIGTIYGIINQKAFIRQYFRDPLTTDWRSAFRIIYYDAEGRLHWEDGEKIDGTGRYNTGSLNAYVDIVTNYHHDQTDMTYGDVSNTPPQIRNVYDTSMSGGVSRLQDKREIYFDSAWHTLEDYTYQNSTTGIFRLTSKKKYSDATHYLETSYTYNDNDFPEKPNTITEPDGSRIVYDYNNAGDVASITYQRYNTSTLVYDTFKTITYTYLTSGVNAGLVDEYTISYPSGTAPSSTVDYVYETTDGNKAGQLLVVTVDDKPTTYTYDDFTNIATEETDDGIITNTYSGTGQTDTMYPPRLLQTEDLQGNITSYAYNSKDLTSSITEADGDALERTTSYTYDRYGNDYQVTDSGSGVTHYKYDIYNMLIELTDPEGSKRSYAHDSFGRVAKENVYDSTGIDLLYRKELTYVSDSGSGCGTCGGAGANAIAHRRIVNGDDEYDYQDIYYEYDMLGRMTGIGTTSAASDYILIYDGAHVVEIDHDSSLWADQTLSYEYDNHNLISAETYPNGRKIEFAYDAAGRLVSIKDPFGFINSIGYKDNAKGQLDTLAHSTLGTAQFTYNADDRLTQIELGNGAYTNYDYDAYGRLNEFDIYNSSTNRLLKHAWTYDNLNRKGDITVTFPGISQNLLDITYGEKSQLTRETFKISGGASTWDVQYGYDDAYNRTGINDGILNKIIGYGGDNRETSVSGFGTALSYDYQGRVTSRTPMAGGNSYNYTWNAYDRLTAVTRTGQDDVSYAYDIMGRLLKKTRDLNGENESVTENYWLGLNKIAEETWGEESGRNLAVFRPYSEDQAANASWSIFGDTGAQSLTYANDNDRGKVLRMQSSAGAAFGGTFVIGDHPDVTSTGLNGNTGQDAWADGDRYHLGMWVKNGSALADKTMQITVLMENTVGQVRQISFATKTGTDGISGSCVTDYIGTSYNDNEWHYLEFDLSERLASIAGESLDMVHGLIIRCANLYVDDIILSGGTLKRSYQVIPGAAINGVLGVQTGREDSYDSWYYHYNDLGTNIATTDKYGSALGMYESDFWGNYRFVSGARPDTMGLTGKFFDNDSGLYYFGSRWYDCERGRFMSLSTYGPQVEQPYAFDENNVVDMIDPTGALATTRCLKALSDLRRAEKRLQKRLKEWEEDRCGTRAAGDKKAIKGHEKAIREAQAQVDEARGRVHRHCKNDMFQIGLEISFAIVGVGLYTIVTGGSGLGIIVVAL